MSAQSLSRRDSWETIHFSIENCCLGLILVATTQQGLCAVFLGDDPEELRSDLQKRFPTATLIPADKNSQPEVAQVIRLIQQPNRELTLPLDLRGTIFQCRVWQALRQIPVGSTKSYAQIAHCIGLPKAVRAVAGACAANPIAIAIPCHRVVRKNGDLSGYRWGVERKQALLQHEGAG
jgi:AraC family transcriptional regulator, regulatory protein of adaptative response / methylated-DNA-[protein]-cysteine methyltransferase